MRFRFFLYLSLFFLFFLNNLFSVENQEEKIKIFVPKAPPALPFIKTAEEENIEIIYYNDLNTEVLPILYKNKNYLFVLPLNIGAKLKNKGEDIIVLEILTKGMIYLISTKAISLKDLDGKECGIGAPGSSPDVISQFIFKKKNIKIIPRYGDSTEIAKLLIASKIDHAVLPEPLASLVLSKNKNAKRVIDFTEEWKKEENVNFIPQTGLFCYSDFYYKNKNTIDRILTKFDNNVKWINNNIDKIAEKAIKDLELSLDIETMKSSLKYMNLSAICSKDSRKDIEKYLTILNGLNSDLAGGKLPDDSFYLY